MAKTLLVKEIYLSIQGESTWAGLPCIFVRLAGCDLRCSYCDSVYAFRGGERLSVETVLERVQALVGKDWPEAVDGRMPLVEITGGEPLLQAPVIPFMEALCDRGYEVLLETSGAHPIESVPPAVRRIVDLKCPSSGESDRVLWSNVETLRAHDEVKFVIGTREDYAWAKEVVERFELGKRCSVLFSSVAALSPGQQSAELKPVPADYTALSREDLVASLLADCLPVRFQLQKHKFIWPPDQIGV